MTVSADLPSLPGAKRITSLRRSSTEAGGTDITISLTARQAETLGPDAGLLADWLGTALQALTALRASPQPTAAAWHTVISDLSRHLMPRLEGILSAAMREHGKAGGSIGDLALAMDSARSTAQYRRQALRSSPPGTWEQWASGTDHATATAARDSAREIKR